MKYIFDFDDVLFNNTEQFKKHMFKTIAEVGIPETEARAYYLEVREKEFSLKNFARTLFARFDIKIKTSLIYKSIIKECPNFLNHELIREINKLGKENCYLVTNGEEKFQKDKITYSKIGNLFKQIYIVSGTKKEIIYAICDKNKKDKIIFVEDKIKFIEDIDLKKCPNLKTVLYDINKKTSIVFYS